MSTELDLLGQLAQRNAALGWRVLWIMPSGNPQTGSTGYDGVDLPRPADAVTLSLGCPDGVMAFDVDQYVKDGHEKTGADTLRGLEAELGPLPPTWKITSRGPDDPGGKLPYRVPPGTVLSEARAGKDVELIQRHHRHTWAPGTEHPRTKTTVKVYDADGQWCEPPPVSALPWLPPAWLDRLQLPARTMTTGDTELPPDDGRCSEALEVLRGKDFGGADPQGGRAFTAVKYLKNMDAEGHLIGGIIDDFLALAPNTSLAHVEGMWARATVDADKVRLQHTCCGETLMGFPLEKLARAAANGHDSNTVAVFYPVAASAEPAVEGEAVQVPSTVPYVFDPVHAHDNQELADACLFAASGWARFAADAALWLTPDKDKEHWVSHSGDLAPWIVTKLADFMPHGISPKKAEADGLDFDDPQVKADITRFTNRVTCRSAGGSAGVAAKMRSRVAVAGDHGVTLRLADLDADPGIIWAGGKAWDIRKSRETLTAAEIDLGTPHLKTCRYAPDATVATPLWDAFLAAVWPLEDLRTWALRQLSQAVTGYGDKVFPVLSGMTDTGKTSVVVLVTDLLGSYAVTVAPELLTGAGSSSMEYARFELKGARLAFMDEAPRTGKLAQSALKALTGGAEIHGRPPYGKPVQFRPSHTLIATANPGSDPPLTDPAVRGRIRLVGCGGDVAAVRTARTALGPLDGETWRAEAPGVLAQLIMRAAEVLADPALVRNENAPAVITALAEQMAAGQDTVARWLAEETESWTPGTRGGELHESYVAWCKRHSDARPESQVEWGRRMNGVPSKKLHNVSWYLVKARYRSYDSYR